MSSRIDIPKELLDQVGGGNCVVFVGAGPSQGAGLPSWPQLLRQMLDWAQAHGVDVSDRAEFEGYIAKDDPLLAAEELQERMGDERFRRFMAEVFRKHGLKPTEAHLLIPRIPFAAAVTTNYDDLLETAYTLVNSEKPHVFTHRDVSELSAALRTGEFYVLKAHGTIDRMDTIVLGRKSYRDVIHANPPYRQHLTSLFSGKTVLFLGFGLTDPDLLLLLDEMRAVFSGHTGHHFALMDERQVPAIKRKRFESDYGIVIIPYTPSAPDHPEVRVFLESLVEQARAAASERTAATVLQRVDELNRELARDESPDFRLVAQVVIEPKPSETGEARPLPLSMQFDFSGDDPATRQAREDLRHHFETGAPVRIKSPHLKGFTLPDAMQKLVSPPGEDAVLELRPRPRDTLIPVKFEVECDDGKIASLDYIVLRMVQVGTVEVTLSNDGQPLVPWRVTLVNNQTSRTFNFGCHMKYSGANVFQALEGLRFTHAMSKGGQFRMINLLNGFTGRMAQLAPGMYPSPDPVLFELVERLLFIQNKTNTLFTVPEGDISMDDVEAALDAARIIETGRDTLSVETMTARGGVEYARNMLEMFVGGEPKYMVWRPGEERTVTILGVNVSLGPLVFLCDKTIIAEEDQETIRRALESAAEGSEQQEISVRFTPVDDSRVEVLYPKWLPEKEAAALEDMLRKEAIEPVSDND
jgi:SIR2-like domain